MDKLQLLARALDRAFGDRLGSLAKWSGLLVFNYHRIGDPGDSPYDHDVWSASTESFAAQMAFLAQDFDVLGLDDLGSLNGSPGPALRGRSVLVTFDDGYRDNFEVAFPILRAQGLKAAFFVSAAFLDGGGLAWWDEIAWMVRRATCSQLPASVWLPAALPLGGVEAVPAIRRLLRVHKDLPAERTGPFIEWLAEATGAGRCSRDEASATWMTWDMVRAMRKAGMSIGGHAVNHVVLARLDAAAQEREILGAAARLRAELGEPMRWFAYPVGGHDAFNGDTRRILDQAGVELAFSYYGGYSRPGKWDRFDVRRVAVEPSVDRARFRALTAFPSLFGSPASSSWTTRLRDTVRERLSR
jgi:peptidoglycan/xylan/chitin deacetylase (PgdA/CDA1 family)